MTKIFDGLDFNTSSIHMTFGLEALVPSSNNQPENIVQFPVPPVKRFGLEDVIEEQLSASTTETTDVFVIREIERLLDSGRHDAAYDLYLLDAVYDTPETFQEFIASYLGCDTI